MQFGVGVLGATGFIGTPYRQETRESPGDAKIIALHGRRKELLEAAKAEDRAELVTDDWRRVVEHPDVNLVYICTPDALHHEAVMRCAELKKHVMCEKPVGLNVREAGEMWQAIRAAGVGHFVPFWSRYVPVCVRARELVRSGVLGDIRVVVYRWHNPRPGNMPFTWRDDAAVSSAGSIADVGSHAYDTLRWLLGVEATRVLAHADVITPAKPDLGDVNLGEAIAWSQAALSARSPRPRGGGEGTGPEGLGGQQGLRKGTAYDYASIAFELSNGAAATLILSHATFVRKGVAPEIELHGTEGSLAISRFLSTLTLVKPGEDPKLFETIADPGFGNRFAKHVFPGLRDRIAGQPTEHPGLDDGYRVQLFTDAAARSAREGRWVAVEE